jgi:AAA15 family ATPase/GTPase
MLLRFRVSNYRSLRTEQEFSLVAANALKDNPDAVNFIDDDLGVLRCAAIYGANASGKSNVLKAFQFMASAVENSQSSWTPGQNIKRDAFRLDESKPTFFEVDVLLKGVRYQYGFAIDSNRVIHEQLYAYPNNKKQEWFTRKAQEFRFGKNLKGGKGNIAALTRPNSLFLSAAAQNNHKMLTPIYKWFSEFVVFLPSNRQLLSHVTTLQIQEDTELKEQIQRFLGAADIGMCEVSVGKKKLLESHRKLASAFADAVDPGNETSSKVMKMSTIPEASLLHNIEGGGRFVLPLGEESDGTQMYFALLGPILETLKCGAALFIDEIDASLHPLLCLRIVHLFNSSATNPKGAQLIFATHDTTLLRESNLRRDQLWFTEKDDSGGTHLYPLTDFKPRANENLERGYLQGRYGAIPVLGDFGAILKEGR